jgi:hypothetical protein
MNPGMFLHPCHATPKVEGHANAGVAGRIARQHAEHGVTVLTEGVEEAEVIGEMLDHRLVGVPASVKYVDHAETVTRAAWNIHIQHDRIVFRVGVPDSRMARVERYRGSGSGAGPKVYRGQE